MPMCTFDLSVAQGTAVRRSYSEPCQPQLDSITLRKMATIVSTLLLIVTPTFHLGRKNLKVQNFVFHRLVKNFFFVAEKNLPILSVPPPSPGLNPGVIKPSMTSSVSLSPRKQTQRPPTPDRASSFCSRKRRREGKGGRGEGQMKFFAIHVCFRHAPGEAIDCSVVTANAMVCVNYYSLSAFFNRLFLSLFISKRNCLR